MNGRTVILTGPLVTTRDTHDDLEAQIAESAPLAFRIAYAVLRHHQDAEDVAQEAFAKAARSIRRLRDPARFRAWLVRLTWRLAIDHRRSDRRRATRESTYVEGQDGLQNVRSGTSAYRRAERLWDAIDSLPHTFRIVIVLSAIQGYDVSEVARLLRIPEGTVKWRLFEGRKRLKDYLQ